MKRKYFVIMLFGFVYILLSTSPVYALPPLSNQEAIGIIEKGFLNKQALLLCPIGKIIIKPALFYDQTRDMLLGTEKGTFVFQYKVKDNINSCSKIGLINIRENYSTRSTSIAERMVETQSQGEKYFVSLTKKGESLKFSESKSGFPQYKLGEIKIRKIVKNQKYESVSYSQNEVFRLVMGVWAFIPTKIKVDLNPNGDPRDIDKEFEEHFKALLKYDSFKEKYEYVTFDSKKPDAEKWTINSIP